MNKRYDGGAGSRGSALSFLLHEKKKNWHTAGFKRLYWGFWVLALPECLGSTGCIGDLRCRLGSGGVFLNRRDDCDSTPVAAMP